MLPEVTLPGRGRPWSMSGPWATASVRLAIAWLALAIATLAEWRAMGHQWWNIDTYNHILLVPGIIGWLVWLRREDLAKVSPEAWWPGLLGLLAGLAVCLVGRVLEINLVAQVGVIVAGGAAVTAILGLRAALVLAFPLSFALFLVPFGDELIPALQAFTARMTVALTHLSGVPAAIDGLFIDTPAGRFVVAEECSGVKFLIAMTALTTLVAWTGFSRWRPRILLVLGAATLSVLANGVRAWGTIFVAQYVGIEKAGGFDHIVYGWVFFALVIAAVLGIAWRFFDREPQDAGLTADEVGTLSLVSYERLSIAPNPALLAILASAGGFAVAAMLV